MGEDDDAGGRPAGSNDRAADAVVSSPVEEVRPSITDADLDKLFDEIANEEDAKVRVVASPHLPSKGTGQKPNQPDGPQVAPIRPDEAMAALTELFANLGGSKT